MIIPATDNLPDIVIPDMLVVWMRSGHGEAAATEWLENVPLLLDSWCRRWNITILSKQPPMSFNLVLFAESATAGEVVLKLNLPSSEFRSEIEALAQARDEGMVRLIDADPSAALMTLDRIRPGTPRRDVPIPDRESTMIGASTMKRFWRTPGAPGHLHRLRPWFQSPFTFPGHFSTASSPIPMHLVGRALAVADHFLSEPRDEVLLHGDIHHANILRGSEQGGSRSIQRG